VFNFFESRVRPTELPPSAPPPGLIAFYWHFIRQTRALYAAMFVTGLEGKTVIAIAHRLSTIARMDRLIVLEQGRIVEQGTHDELLRLGGHYALLWKHQSGGFLPHDVAVADDALQAQVPEAGPLDDMRSAEQPEPQVSPHL